MCQVVFLTWHNLNFRSFLFLHVNVLSFHYLVKVPDKIVSAVHVLKAKILSLYQQRVLLYEDFGSVSKRGKIV